jgi:hypothetical protein
LTCSVNNAGVAGEAAPPAATTVEQMRTVYRRVRDGRGPKTMKHLGLLSDAIEHRSEIVVKWQD